MPNVYFYAAEGDQPFLLDLIFRGKHSFRVFERRSAVNEALREFNSPAEVLEHWNVPDRFRGITLLADGAASAPTVTRVDLRGNYATGSFDYRCEGWGLIHLQVGRAHHGVLERSSLSHNSERRAIGWASTNPRLGSPSAWTWPAVTSASGWLARQIRQHAAAKVGTWPVLADASRLLTVTPAGEAEISHR